MVLRLHLFDYVIGLCFRVTWCFASYLGSHLGGRRVTFIVAIYICSYTYMIGLFVLCVLCIGWLIIHRLLHSFHLVQHACMLGNTSTSCVIHYKCSFTNAVIFQRFKVCQYKSQINCLSRVLAQVAWEVNLAQDGQCRRHNRSGFLVCGRAQYDKWFFIRGKLLF